MKPHLALIWTTVCLGGMAVAQTTQSYTDSTGEISGSIGSQPHLDIKSVDVSLDVSALTLTFRIHLNGDPVATNWGKYMVAIRSADGGTTTGNGWGRPIDFTPGITHWIGTWIDTSPGGQVWSYGGGSWSVTSSVSSVTAVGTPGNYVDIVVPRSALGIDVGETFSFDVYTSGGGTGDGAVDALSATATSIANWGDPFTTNAVGGSPNPALTFTMPPQRDVTFAVNMRVLEKLGKFTPGTDSVRVVGAYWNGFTPADGPLMSDPDNDGIYTVTAPVIGFQGNTFGGYKFWTNSSALPLAWNGFERGSDRTANLGAGGMPQTIPADWFRHDNLDGTGNYYQWADAYGLNLNSSECEPTSDPDFDSNINRVEFLFGRDPKVGDGSLLAISQTGGNVLLTWLERNDIGATYLLRESTLLDGNDWTTSAVTPANGDPSGVPFGYTRREATVSTSSAPKFFRISGTIP